MGKEKAKETMPAWKKAIIIIVDIILALCVVIGVICAYSTFRQRKGIPATEVLGLYPLIIQTDSMTNEQGILDNGEECISLEVGDLIIGRKVKDKTTLEIGDIVSYETIIGGKRVINTHRIVNKYIDEETGVLMFETQGNKPGAPVDKAIVDRDIVCKYVFSLGGLGKVVEFLQTSLGFGLIILLPIAVFFIWQLVGFFRSLFAYQAEKVRVQYADALAQQNQKGENDAESDADTVKDKTDGQES